MLFFTSCVPARLLFLFGLTGYIYLFKDDGLLGKVSVRQAGVGENLRNSMTFAWGFVEIAAWFWVSIHSSRGFGMIALTLTGIYKSARGEKRVGQETHERAEKRAGSSLNMAPNKHPNCHICLVNNRASHSKSRQVCQHRAPRVEMSSIDSVNKSGTQVRIGM